MGECSHAPQGACELKFACVSSHSSRLLSHPARGV